ncbi:MAG: hypothetical protein ACF8GE_02295 [Phycisphaerales bacterium JB043]
MRLILMLLLKILVSTPALAQDDAPSIILEEAQAAFVQGHEMLESDPNAARAHYTRSALLFERLINDHGYDTADAHYNHANALLLSAQPGRAIAAYLRAQRLRPHDSAIQAGLEHARQQASIQVPPSPGTRLADVVTIWRGIIPRSMLLWLAILSWLTLWCVSILRLRLRAHISSALIPGTIVVCLVCAGALILEQQLLYSDPVGVVVIDDTPAYNGPDSRAYDQTFTTPLAQGVECRILERRDEWMHIELRSGDTTWVRASSVEPV